MIKVESKFKDFGIQIPTDISEITSEALDAILTNVVIAKHYCVVALCQNESLFGAIYLMLIMSISRLNTSNSINKTIVDNTNATNPKVSSVMFIRMAYRHHSLQ
jgi:hypothetical protein